MITIKKIINPKYYLLKLMRSTAVLWSDEMYIKMYYLISMGRWPNLKNPHTFQEKLNWLKLNYRMDNQYKYVDKYEVKKYVENVIGKEYVVPLLGVWKSFDEIDFDSLPNQFVLKCTHDSGSFCICKDKNIFDINLARKRINKGLRRNYYLTCREWPYKHCKPMIIAEKFLSPTHGEELKDYKFFCFNGKPKFMYVSNDVDRNAKTDFFDMDYKHLDMRMKDPNSESVPSKPEQFERMKSLASKLCQGFPHVRVDFYIVDNKIYFGELTFFHNGGFQKIYPSTWNLRLGNWIILPNKEIDYKE